MTSWAWMGNQEGWEGFGVVGAPRRSECIIQGRRSQQRSYALFLKIRWRVVTAAETQEYQDLVRRCSWVYFWTHPEQENIQVDTPPTKCRPWECDDVRHSLGSFLSEHRLYSRPALTWPWPCRLLTSASQTLSGARQGSPSCFVEQRTLLFFGTPESWTWGYSRRGLSGRLYRIRRKAWERTEEWQCPEQDWNMFSV